MLPYVTIASGVFAATAVVYSKIRPNFRVKVDCWFCQKSLRVPYASQNSWVCPHCEQYNGFTEDGDYNRVLPAQKNEELNQNIYARKSNLSSDNFPNGFCSSCTLNQQLKIQQLSSFTPLSEDCFDQEIEAYQKHLERTYKLCLTCQALVENKLEEQSLWLKRNILASQLEKAKSAAHNLKISFRFCSLTQIVFHIHWAILITALIADLQTLNILRQYISPKLFTLEHKKLQDVTVLGFSFAALCALFPCSSRKSYPRKWSVPILWLFKYAILAHFVASTSSPVVQSSMNWLASWGILVLNLENWPFSIPKLTAKPSSIRNMSSTSKGNEFPPPPSPSIQPWDSASQITPDRLKEAMSDDADEFHSDDLDTSIGSLRIGPGSESKAVSNPHVFAPQHFTTSPKKSILSPSRLGALPVTQASWVAGGYFQTPLKPVQVTKPQLSGLSHALLAPACNVSRSSSQSSGFVSHSSEQGKRPAFSGNSLPASRASSLCGDWDRFSALSEQNPSFVKPLKSKLGLCNSLAPSTSPMAVWRAPESVLRNGEELRISSLEPEYSDNEETPVSPSYTVLRSPSMTEFNNYALSAVSANESKSMVNTSVVKQGNNWAWLPFLLGFSVAVNLCAAVGFFVVKQSLL